MHSMIHSITNICNILFTSLYNNIKIYINPNTVYDEELDREFHGNINYTYGKDF